MELILASQSPRRRELFSLVGLDYTAITSDADENIPFTEPGDFVEQEFILQLYEFIAGRMWLSDINKRAKKLPLILLCPGKPICLRLILRHLPQ